MLFVDGDVIDYKLDPFLIHTCAKPHCYINAKEFHWKCIGNQSSLITSKFFADWFEETFLLEANTYLTSKKLQFQVFLLLDNAFCESIDCLFDWHSNVLVHYLHANSSRNIEQLDQIVSNTSKYYFSHFGPRWRPRLRRENEWMKRIKVAIFKFTRIFLIFFS